MARPTGGLKVRVPVVITAADVVYVGGLAQTPRAADLALVVVPLQNPQPDLVPIKRQPPTSVR
ncbi:hypothetical protein [Mycobacterium pseudokansasii]|uniref:hypothetical protein n=1 Tax=Mycobacterium pseudokansasii TaxID=2341080 RepID=UPI001C3FDD88|nr:hypothetical protein [Mycobacterium pseudokansasii]